MLLALCVIVALKLKQQTTISCVNLLFATNRKKLLNDLLKIDSSLRNLKDDLLLDIILFGSDKHKDTVNKEILLHTTDFIKNTKRFQRPLFDQ